MPRWRIKFPNYIYDVLLLLYRYDLPVMLLRQCLRVLASPLGMNVCAGCICFHFYATFIALFTECAEFLIHFHDIEYFSFLRQYNLSNISTYWLYICHFLSICKANNVERIADLCSGEFCWEQSKAFIKSNVQTHIIYELKLFSICISYLDNVNK